MQAVFCQGMDDVPCNCHVQITARRADQLPVPGVPLDPLQKFPAAFSCFFVLVHSFFLPINIGSAHTILLRCLFIHLYHDLRLVLIRIRPYYDAAKACAEHPQVFPSASVYGFYNPKILPAAGRDIQACPRIQMESDLCALYDVILSCHQNRQLPFLTHRTSPVSQTWGSWSGSGSPSLRPHPLQAPDRLSVSSLPAVPLLFETRTRWSWKNARPAKCSHPRHTSAMW